MKKLLVLTGILVFAALNESGLAQTGPVTAAPPIASGSIGSGAGSVSIKSVVSNAETERAVQEARKMKALKAAMADKSFQHRQPVSYTASQFLANNRPPPAPVSASENSSPYLVPETYPRTSVPAFKPAKKSNNAGGNDSSGSNTYSYPGRVNENDNPVSSPEAEVSANSGNGLPKKRPSFFKWMKQRKSKPTTKANSQIGNTPSVAQSDSAAPEEPETVKKQAEEAITKPVVTSTLNTPIPPPSASATPVGPLVSASTPAESAPSSTVKPVASATPARAQNPATNGGGLFGKLFSKQGQKKSSRTISSDPAQPSIDLPSN